VSQNIKIPLEMMSCKSTSLEFQVHNFETHQLWIRIVSASIIPWSFGQSLNFMGLPQRENMVSLIEDVDADPR